MEVAVEVEVEVGRVRARQRARGSIGGRRDRAGASKYQPVDGTISTKVGTKVGTSVWTALRMELRTEYQRWYYVKAKAGGVDWGSGAWHQYR